jgi:polar amino acid transport system substrate-binding protein
MLLRLGLFLALSALFSYGLPVAADPLPQYPIVIGIDPDFPPYEFVTISGESAGLNIDLSRAIGEVMGVEVSFRYAPWHELRRQLMTGQIDILSGVPYTEERDSELDFTPPHAQIYQSLWVRRDSALRDLTDLGGSRVLVVQDGVMQEYLNQRPQLNAQSIPVDSLEDALRLLAIGEYDAAMGGKLSGEYLLGRLQVDSLKTIDRPLLTQEYGFAVKAGNREMLSLITEGLALLKQSGRYRQIFNRWIGPLPQQEGISFQRVLRIGALILVPLLLGLTLMVLWSTTLRRQVRQRTAALKQEVAERERAMKELESRQQQLIQADKLASLGVLTSGVAHEINNPNALLLLNLPQLRRAWQDIAPILEQRYREQGDFDLGRIPYSQMRDEIPEMLREMLSSAGRIKRIVADLKDFVRRDEQAAMNSIDLNDVARAAVRLVENPLKNATAHFSLQLQEPLPQVYGNSQRLEQVIINLLLNAAQALESRDQTIELTTCSTPEAIILEVFDQGRGIAPEHLGQLTDPFFTTKREEGGTGLGLSVSTGIVNEHNGSLEFFSTAESGTSVKLSLPRKGGTP